MRFTTLLPMLLAAGVAQAQFGGNGGQNGGNNGQNGGNNGQNGGNNGQNGGNNGQNGGNNGQNGQNNGQDNNNNGGNNNNNNNNGGNNNALALNPDVVQTNSQVDGLAEAEAGQAASATDEANFINFCEGKTLTNGLQVREGSCNGIVMGEIPAAGNMVSAVFQSPQDGEDIESGAAITFSVKIANLQAGSFTNPDITYYAAPQALQGGQVVGHTHITVQDMNNNKNPQEPLDAETFAFFKGINDNGDGNGLLSADLAAGLPDGTYRVCSMTSSSNHQPVLMPVAQRGAQDDCVRFTVGAGNGGNNNNNNNGGNNDNNNNGQNNNDNGQGQNNGQNGGNNGQGQNNGQNGGNNGQGQNNGQQGQGQGGQGGQGQGGQGGQGQGGQGGARGRGRGRGRFNRRKFAARDFIA